MAKATKTKMPTKPADNGKGFKKVDPKTGKPDKGKFVPPWARKGEMKSKKK